MYVSVKLCCTPSLPSLGALEYRLGPLKACNFRRAPAYKQKPLYYIHARGPVQEGNRYRQRVPKDKKPIGKGPHTDKRFMQTRDPYIM